MPYTIQNTISEMSSSSALYRSSDDTTVFVQVPNSHKNDAVSVEPERNKSHIRRFLESSFLGEQSKRAPTEQEMQEMNDRLVHVRQPSSARDTTVNGDFDICREYSYFVDDYDPYYIQNNLQTEIKQQTTDDPNVVMTHILGKTYHPVKDYSIRRVDEASLFWFTYRCDFPDIVPYNINSDAGWGCMLRSAMMMLAQALRLHFKSRDWKPPQQLSRRRHDPFVRSMLTWFADFPSSSENVYSLHNMVAAGLAKYDKLPGEWYGPGTACYVIRDLVEMHERQQGPQVEQKVFRVYVASQQTVYRKEIEALMTRNSSSSMALIDQEREKKYCRVPEHPLDSVWDDELIENGSKWETALLLLIPLRLGLKSFNQDYIKVVTHTFSLPQSVGVLGGRPRGARWFYGAAADASKIYGLDPHTVQNAPRKRAAQVNGKNSQVVELSDDYLRSVHTTFPEAFSLLKMDPSIALGFYCKSGDDMESVFSELLQWSIDNPGFPDLFTVADAAPDYANVSSAIDDMMLSGMDCSIMDGGDDRLSDEDEYVVL
jgi:cysteine protease ATG4